jgi:NADH-quinone oxidoreductase subunit G
MATITVNGKDIQIGDNERLNLVQAAERAGVHVPHYCWHPALTVVASCRMCLVEVGDKHPDGSVKMQPRVVPACQTPAKNGTVVITNSPRAQAAQQQTLEGLLLNHPLDCPVCDKAGECMLQDYSFRYGRAESRMIDEKFAPPNKPDIGHDIALFTDRCIKCSRCVRFTREISGTAELQFVARGEHEEIDIFPGEPCDNKLAGNVVDLCPVGALCSKDFLYKQRVWFLQPKKSVCPNCSTGCSIFVDSNKDILYRLRPRENLKAQGHFMCDEGRLGYHYANSDRRLIRAELLQDGHVRHPHYEPVINLLRKELKEAAAKDASGVAAVLSPFLTCEEAYLLARYFKGLSPQTRLALGPVPVVGEDDTYPKDRRGRPVQPVLFTIRAEKCPNRRGVEEILRHFQGEVISYNDILWAAGEGKLHAVYIAAGYVPRPEGSWITEEQAAGLKRVPLLVVHDLFPSPASAHAKYRLPAATFAEKDGCFVNHAGLAQEIHRGVHPPRDFRTDGQVFLDLTERRGLLHAPTLRAELAREVPFFAALGDGHLGEEGVFLGK